MSVKLQSEIGRTPGSSKCLTRSVLDVLSQEPALEAVTIDAAHEKISVATLGRADVEKLTQSLTSKIHSARSNDSGRACSLLEGKSDCSTCDSPLTEAERQRITVKNEGGSTTIARVTCPTAPKFWRWRDLPFPKVAPREIELELDEVEHHVDEWKLQLVAAVFCGAFGLLAAFVVPGPGAPSRTMCQNGHRIVQLVTVLAHRHVTYTRTQPVRGDRQLPARPPP